MVTRVVQRAQPTVDADLSKGYQTLWAAGALLTASVWTSVAIVQAHRLPLVVLAALNGLWAGLLFVRAPAHTARARHQYLTGCVAVMGLVFALVGIRYHVEVGLASVALLAATSPAVIRWVARG